MVALIIQRVRPTENVGLSVLQSKAMTADDLDERSKAVVIERSLSALSLVVIFDFEDAE
jgi:hypothetical protein